MSMTFPQLLIERAYINGSQVALREKEFGIWNEITYEAFLEKVKNFSLGLASLGLKKGG